MLQANKLECFNIALPFQFVSEAWSQCYKNATVIDSGYLQQ
jgi:hypothetical protein